MTSKKPTLVDIENAFLPAREIESAERFAGRRDQIEAAYLALVGLGTNLALIGNRGIGKTSLARQIVNIAGGKVGLLDRATVAYERPLDFLPLYFACGSDTETIPQLLGKLLTNKACLADWIYDIPQASKLVGSLSPKFNLNLGGVVGFGGELGSVAGEKQAAPAIIEHDIQTIFSNVADAIVKAKIARDGILIVVDEFDQIRDRSGFAPFLKSLATNTPQVKFCIVGVAQNLKELIDEHASADRLFAGSMITMPAMSDDELREVITLAQDTIGNAIMFHVDAITKVLALAQGHPYMVHLIGKYALRAAHRAGASVVMPADIDSTLATIAEGGADPLLERRYQKCIGTSPQREIVLRSIAECTDSNSEALTTNAYSLALQRGVDNASQYVGHLCAETYGAELTKLRERYYGFKDSLFRAYVQARPRALANVAMDAAD